MCEEIKNELDNGQMLADKLAKHLMDMGAANCTIPVEIDNRNFEVSIKHVEKKI